MANLTGSTTAVFFVRLSTAVDEIVDVDWNTRDGTAIAGQDYEAASGTVSFLPGETEKAIDVVVYGQDDVSANGKKFYIELKPPANAVLTDALAECVITVADEEGVLVTSLVIAQGKRGFKGNPGLSAYEQAVLMGYTGTVDQWMNEIADASQAAIRSEEYAVNSAASAETANQKAIETAQIGDAKISAMNDIAVIVTAMSDGKWYFKTEALLLASKPPSNTAAKALDTKKVWFWKTTNGGVSGTWTDTGLSELDQAIARANAAEANAKQYADNEKASKKAVDQVGSTSVALQFATEDLKDLGHINSDGSHFLSGEDESLQDQLKNRPKKIGDKLVAYSLDDSNNQSMLSIAEDGCLYLAGDERSVQDQILASKSDGRIAVINDAKLSTLSRSVEDISWLKKQTRISSSRDTTPNASNRIPAVVKIPTGVLIMYCESISPYDGDTQGARLMQRFVAIDSDYKVTSISAAQEVTRPSVDTGLTKHPMLCRAANGNLVLIYDERETTSTNYRQYVRTSSDNGVNWSSAVEITQNPAAGGQVCAVGSTGAMIVLGSGRIVCPMYTTNSVWMMYSDNNGTSWTHGAMASGTVSGTSYLIAEPAITLDKNNEILVSVRSQKTSFYKKLLYKSTDNGATTQFYRIADELNSASCASSIFYDSENDLMLHSTPSNAGAARTKYRLQYSTDNGANFIGAYRPFSETLYVGYSQIIKLASNTYLVVFEGDEYFKFVNAYENIATLIINTAEILNHVNYS